MLNLAARHREGRWAMVYLAAPASFSLHLEGLSGPARAFWVDPRTGDSVDAGRFDNTGAASFSTPESWEDALLVLEATDE